MKTRFVGILAVFSALGTFSIASPAKVSVDLVAVPSGRPQAKVNRSVPETKKGVSGWCQETKEAIEKLKWKIDPCEGIAWQIAGTSVSGRPLVFTEFGDGEVSNTTLVFSTVHGDEITPFFIALQLARWAKDREASLKKTRLIIAPMVNPDGFLDLPRSRMNANGVDLNRNFATDDWKSHALQAWRGRFKSDPRRFPGFVPRSEPETHFQEELIRRYSPQKILSIHSPLNFLDYDGPSTMRLSRFPKDYLKECERFKKQVKARSTGYFPGSLGNYAGRELGIPTLTLELPSADPKKAESFWNKFSQGISKMIEYAVPNYTARMLPQGGLMQNAPSSAGESSTVSSSASKGRDGG